MADLDIIDGIKRGVTIPVMAKCRIGHVIEARVLESMEIDFIDESEVLTPADNRYHVDKWPFKVPFVCGCRNIGEALRRLSEGAAMIRTKGEAGTGNIVEAMRHIRGVQRGIGEAREAAKNKGKKDLAAMAKEMRVDVVILEKIAESGKLPVVNFAAGGIATPSDAAMCMQMGCDGVFVGSGIFKSADPLQRAKAIVQATAHYNDPDAIARVSEGLGDAMPSIDMRSLTPESRMATRGI